MQYFVYSAELFSRVLNSYVVISKFSKKILMAKTYKYSLYQQQLKLGSKCCFVYAISLLWKFQRNCLRNA